MLICITGTGYVSRKAAEELIKDFIFVPGYVPSEIVFMMPSYMTTDGLKNTRDVIKEFADNKEYNCRLVSFKKNTMADEFRNWDDKHKVIFVLDADSDREFLNEVDSLLTYDLSRGLYPAAPELALDGSVSHAEALTEPVRYDGLEEKESPLKSLSGASEATVQIVELTKTMSYEDLKEVEEIVRHAIHIREQNMHPVYTEYRNGTKFHSETLENAGQEIITATEPLDKERIDTDPGSVPDSPYWNKTKYYKSKRGNMRKAGRSKARPGETEVWLTQEEIDKL